MKKTMKQIVSCLLLVCLLVGMVPTTVGAKESDSAEINNGPLSVEGTNSFGTLLSEEIQQQQETAYSGDYNIVSLTVADGVATVEYDSVESANLVVSLYTEDGEQLLSSGKTVVQPGSEKAQVEIEGAMPEYFLATAYLLDDYDYSPLCQAYETPMYTREMQQLLESDVSDYDADKVLNLDADTDTNFAVYADTTKVIDYVAGVNTVAGVDDATATYVIENADSRITDLRSGDVFAYAYAEDKLLIAKVASIKKSGTTVTITGADLEMEEVFSQVKIENTGNTDNITVDDSTADEGVNFKDNPFWGNIPDIPMVGGGLGFEGEESASDTLEYSLKKEAKNQAGTAKVNLDGTLKLGVKVTFSYYVSFSRQYLELRADANMALNVTVTGSYAQTIKLGKLAYSPVPAVSIGFAPELQLSFSGKIELNVTMDMTVGLAFENGTGFRSINKKPKPEARLEGNISIYVGFDFKPSIEVCSGCLLSLSANMPIGATLNAKLCGKLAEGTEETGDSIHDCIICVDIEIIFTLKLSAQVQFLKKEKLTYKTPVKTFELGSVDLYWAPSHQEFGEGSCPYQAYRITFQVQDAEGRAVAGAYITPVTDGYWGGTNSNGVLVKYLPQDTYVVGTVVGDTAIQKQFEVTGPAGVLLRPGKQEKESYIPDNIAPEEIIVNPGTLVDSGKCGDNTYWEYYSNGLLRVYGSGEMTSAPWLDLYRLKIKTALIENSVNNICPAAFEECIYLELVTIDRSVTKIGYRAFRHCESLISISIPESVTEIGNMAFYSCDELQAVFVSGKNCIIGEDAFYWCQKLESVILNEGVTEIGPFAFSGCSSLKKIVIPSSVIEICGSAFVDCTDLISVTLENGIKTIGDRAFRDCDSLTSITIPASVTSIGGSAFYTCDSLQRVSILGDNTIIGGYAFYYCPKLESVILNEGVTEIGYSAFSGCSSLKEIVIPNGVTEIESYTFADCTNLTSVVIGNSVKTIGYRAFVGCDNLISIVISKSVSEIGSEAFLNCVGLKKINIPNGVIRIYDGAFEQCSNLEEVTFGNGLKEIGNHAFFYCESLPNIVIPESVTHIGDYSFGACFELETVTFYGNAPVIDENVFWETVLSCYYPQNNTSWTKAVFKDYGGKVTWVSYGRSAAVNAAPVSDSVESQENTVVDAVYGGEYKTEIKDERVWKTASFKDLVPGKQYTLLALKQVALDDPLQPDNLLYIKQAAAAADGTLVFSYVQREPVEISYVMVCGASDKDLKDATITVPALYADEELRVVNPTVVYDGKILEEGVDYVLAGKVDYTEAGQYTCYIRGIYDYTGTVELTYTVHEGGLLGDTDGNETLDTNDAVYLLLHIMFGSEDYPISTQPSLDYDGNAIVDTNDAVYLLLHVMFGAEDYPLAV